MRTALVVGTTVKMKFPPAGVFEGEPFLQALVTFCDEARAYLLKSKIGIHSLLTNRK